MSEMEVLALGSKTFSLAARFFPPRIRSGAARIYYWCRHCDDFIDERKGETSTLIENTRLVWKHEKTVLSPPFEALRIVSSEFRIPEVYATELLLGMKMDEDQYQYESISDLEKYCYRVASTVGLMMCHVMGLYDEKALKEAADLGRAMQMTNIARDVKEDFKNERIYLPEEWLRDEGLTRVNMLDLENRKALFRVVRRLIHESEVNYQKARRGFIFLPLKAAIAVTMASLFYREIGRCILRTGEASLEMRTIVPVWRKCILIIQGLWWTVMDLPERIPGRRRLVEIETVWRPV